MTLSRIDLAEQSKAQISPLKAMEGIYGFMMPLWSLSSNVIENTKNLQQELISVIQNANEDVTDRVVGAIDHHQPKELMSASMIASQALSHCFLMSYNAIAEQQYEFVDTWFQLMDKGHQQIYRDSSQL